MPNNSAQAYNAANANNLRRMKSARRTRPTMVAIGTQPNAVKGSNIAVTATTDIDISRRIKVFFVILGVCCFCFWKGVELRDVPWG